MELKNTSKQIQQILYLDGSEERLRTGETTKKLKCSIQRDSKTNVITSVSGNIKLNELERCMKNGFRFVEKKGTSKTEEKQSFYKKSEVK